MVERFTCSRVHLVQFVQCSISSGFNWFKLLIDSMVRLDSARVILVQGLNWFKLSIDSIT